MNPSMSPPRVAPATGSSSRIDAGRKFVIAPYAVVTNMSASAGTSTNRQIGT